jgi:hypothetical protein
LLTLDDGAATAHARVEDGLDGIAPPLQLGEVLNLTGRVMDGTDGIEVATHARDIVRAAVLTATAADGSPWSLPSVNPDAGSATVNEPASPSDTTRLALALAVACLAAFVAVVGGLVLVRAWRHSRRRPDDPPVATSGPGSASSP